MSFETAKAIADEYRKMLRQMKKQGLNIADAPPEVQESALALHQNALLVHEVERQRNKTMKTQNDH